MTLTEQLRQDLEGAVTALDEHGWNRGSYANQQGNLCAMGAVWSSVISHEWMMAASKSEAREASLKETERAHAATQALLNCIPSPFDVVSVAAYNDAQESVEPVRDLFQRAIKELVK